MKAQFIRFINKIWARGEWSNLSVVPRFCMPYCKKVMKYNKIVITHYDFSWITPGEVARLELYTAPCYGAARQEELDKVVTLEYYWHSDKKSFRCRRS